MVDGGWWDTVTVYRLIRAEKTPAKAGTSSSAQLMIPTTQRSETINFIHWPGQTESADYSQEEATGHCCLLLAEK